MKSFHYVKHALDKTSSTNPNLDRGRSLSRGAYEQWYFFPEDVDGPLFMMMQRWDPQQQSKLCSWLQNGKAWGRPVDILIMPDGALLVSDDHAGTIYRISYKNNQ